MADSTHTILHSAKRFFSGTLLSRISGLLRDMSMAYAFGVDASIASFLLAFRFAHLLRRLFGEGALQSAFIPQFEEMRLQNEKTAYGFFCSLTCCISLILVACILIFGLILGSVLKWGNISGANYEVIYLTILMLPSLLFICLYGLNASLLQCERYFFVSSVAPVAFNGIWIISVILLSQMSPQTAMPYLAIGVIGACFFQWLWTVPKTWYFVRKAGIVSLFKESFAHFRNLSCIVKPLSLGILGVSATQINSLIDALFARHAELEGPAILWYAMRLQQLPLALFGIAIAGAILPPLSRAIKSNNEERYTYFLSYGLTTTIALMLPITAMIICMGDTGINLIYGRGDFSHFAIQQTTLCLWAYGLGLIPSALILILAPAYFAKSHYLIPVTTSLINMITNLILNTIFIFVFNWGAFSVAIATSISAWLNLYFLYSKMDISIINKRTTVAIFKLFFISLFSVTSVFLTRYLLGQLQVGFFSHMFWPKDFGIQVYNMIFQISIFTLSVILGILFTKLKVNELFFLNLNSKTGKSTINEIKDCH